jgi:diadenylate cyclase
VAGVLAELGRLTPEELSDTAAVAKAIDLTGDPEALDAAQVPRGYRLLARVPQLPSSVVDRVVERFGSLKVIMAVGPEDLEEVEGVGAGRARLLREGLLRLADGAPRDGDE